MNAAESATNSPMIGSRSRRWSQFRLRSLLVLVSLCCVYFAGLRATQRWGLPAVDAYADARFPYGSEQSLSYNERAAATFPLVAHRIEFDPVTNQQQRRYYLWLFGPVLQVTPGSISHGR